MRKFETMHVQGIAISIEDDYICLTDMVKTGSNAADAAEVIKDWLINKSTIDYLGNWEHIYNTNFQVDEFNKMKERIGEKDYSISVNQWVTKTNAIGIYAKQGKNGKTYAHKDIAFEFGAAISTIFKLYLIKEFQRLKEMEVNANNPDWNVRRLLSKANYTIQTDAIKTHKIPLRKIPETKRSFAYAEEGDILNLALFGFTAKKWRELNLDLAAKNHNVREYASTNELTILSTLEGFNAEMIKQNISFEDRLDKLKNIAREQLAVLNNKYPENSLRKNTEGNFQPFFKNDSIGMFPVKPISLTA